jgi:hypothetical protein
MAFFSNVLGMFDKLDDIIYEPIKLVTDWAREPLRTREHHRAKETEEHNLKLEIERQKLQHKLEQESLKSKQERQENNLKLQIQIEQEKRQSEKERQENNLNIEIKKQNLQHKLEQERQDNDLQRKIKEETEKTKIDAEIRMKEKSHETELAIKKETEVVRIITEIETLKKDQDFQRMKAVSEAISQFQKELNCLNVDAISAIGHLQLDLREKAQKLVYEHTIKYKELQDQAMQDAMNDLIRIEKQFGENEMAKTILITAIDKRLANVIDTASYFLQELNSDIKSLNQNIDMLASSGQKFIERHLEQFHSLGFSQEEIKQLKSSEPKLISYSE